MLSKVLKTLWVLCSVAVLAVTLVRYDHGPASDIGVFLVYAMLFLAFPVSLLVAGLFSLMALFQEQFGVPLLDLIDSNYMGFVVMWLTFFLAGYVQWFVLLPWLWRKWRNRRSRSASPRRAD